MLQVVSVQALDEFRLEVAYDDGVQGIVALGDRPFGPMFEPLRDPAFFRQVFVDEFGAVCWPNGADLAPDALHEQIRNAGSVATAE